MNNMDSQNIQKARMLKKLFFTIALMFALLGFNLPCRAAENDEAVKLKREIASLQMDLNFEQKTHAEATRRSFAQIQMIAHIDTLVNSFQTSPKEWTYKFPDDITHVQQLTELMVRQSELVARIEADNEVALKRLWKIDSLEKNIRRLRTQMAKLEVEKNASTKGE